MPRQFERIKVLGIKLLLEPLGIVTDSIPDTRELLDRLGHEKTVGLNLDTGNLWLGGGDPFEYIKTFGSRIKHVHWKDMGQDWVSKRGTLYGCGLGLIPLSDGIIGIERVVKDLLAIGFNGPTTLEVAGADNVKKSAERLLKWSAS